MPRVAPQESSELLQIVTLTLAMTGAAFAILTLVFKLFLNPGAENDAAQAEKGYAELTRTLLDPTNKELRANAKRSEGQDLTKTLAEIVADAADKNGVKLDDLPKVTARSKQPGLEEQELSINKMQPTALNNLIYFVQDVQKRKKTIQVENFNLKRDTRTKSSEDALWTVSVKFVDYVTQ